MPVWPERESTTGSWSRNTTARALASSSGTVTTRITAVWLHGWVRGGPTRLLTDPIGGSRRAKHVPLMFGLSRFYIKGALCSFFFFVCFWGVGGEEMEKEIQFIQFTLLTCGGPCHRSSFKQCFPGTLSSSENSVWNTDCFEFEFLP